MPSSRAVCCSDSAGNIGRRGGDNVVGVLDQLVLTTSGFFR